MQKNKCPYCLISLSKIPQKKTKCLNCGKFIFVRTDPATNEKILVTNLQIKEIERRWIEKSNDEETLSALHRFEVTDKQIKEEYLLLINRFKPLKPSFSDVFWSIAAKLNQECYLNGDLQKSSDIHYEKALHLIRTNQNPYNSLHGSAISKLMHLKKSGCESVTILGAQDSCKSCQKYIDKSFKIDEAIKLFPIPCKNCDHKFNANDKYGFCRCSYEANPY